LLRYPQYLKGRWAFGEDVEDEVETKAEIDDEIVDVIKLGGCIILRIKGREP
jgi:hypothetical protein